MLGSQAAEVALLVQAKQLTGSPLVVGLLGMAELVPLVVFGLYGGVLADRFDRRALMRWCERTGTSCGKPRSSGGGCSQSVSLRPAVTSLSWRPG